MSNLFFTTIRYNKFFSAHILNSDSNVMQFEIYQKCVTTKVIPIPAMPRAMQSTAIPRRGNPGLSCPRNSAIPLHSHSDLLKPEEHFHHNFPTQLWSTRPTRNWKSQSLVLSTSFYTKGLTALPFFHSLSPFSGQSRAEQGRVSLGRDWPWAQQCWAPVAATLLCQAEASQGLCPCHVCHVLGPV